MTKIYKILQPAILVYKYCLEKDLRQLKLVDD